MDLIICEIFNKKIHGFDENNDPTVVGHYLVSHNFTKIYSDTENDFSDDSDSDDSIENDDININDNIVTDDDAKSLFKNTKIILNLHKTKYNRLTNNMKRHSIIRNYKHIITQPNYIQLHIAKVIYLTGLECVAILKTFWIKLIQRSWKKIYKKRCNVIALRRLSSNLFYREIHGKWPDNCLYLPSINGLLI